MQKKKAYNFCRKYRDVKVQQHKLFLFCVQPKTGFLVKLELKDLPTEVFFLVLICYYRLDFKPHLLATFDGGFTGKLWL